METGIDCHLGEGSEFISCCIFSLLHICVYNSGAPGPGRLGGGGMGGGGGMIFDPLRQGGIGGYGPLGPFPPR